MVSDELTTIVRNKFKEGKRRQEIRDELWQQGYSEEEISVAIAKIQHDAFKQLPGIARIYQLIEDLENKKNFTTPHMTIIVLVCSIGVLIIMAVGLYIVFDPLDTQAGARDTKRDADITQLQNALNAYYGDHQQYPSSLSGLIPDFLVSLPKDPETSADYSYHTANGSASYVLCVSYELKQQQCLSAKPASAVIPIVPTDTPIPTFAPKSAKQNAL
jgi:competence protein ComGC